MTEKFENYAFFYLKIFIILLFVIFICFLLGIGNMGIYLFSYSDTLYKTMSYSFFKICFVTLVLTYIYFFIIVHPLPEELNISSNKDLYYDEGGLNTKIKIDEENKEILKKSMSIFLEKNNKFELQNIYSRVINIFSRKSKNKLPLVSYFTFSINKYYNWRSIKMREKYCKENKFLVKTYDLDERDCSWKEEYITYAIEDFENLDKNKIKTQLKELDNFLKEKKIYLSDVRPANIRLTKNGDIRIIDGEFFTDNEMKYYKIIPYVFLKLPLFQRLTHIDQSLVKYYM
tara:strand:- start:443 stop:1303 length:861 start_codon:yes stop_codon:yes gene_type:complete